MNNNQITRDIETEVSMHEAITRWLDQGHTNGILSDIGYDPIEFPYQRIDVHHLEPNEPSIAYIRRFGAIGMGGADKFESFVDFLKELPDNPVTTTISRAKNGQNSLITGLHLDDVFDVPMIEAGFYCASEKDENAQYNDIWVNELLTRVGIFDMPVMDGLLTKMGQVTIGLAKSETGSKAGITDKMISKVSGPMLRDVMRRDGRTVFLAPTQSTTQPNELGYRLKEIDPIIKKIIARKFGEYTCGIVLHNSGSQSNPDYKWAGTEPAKIKDIEDVDIFMQNMADIATDLIGINTVYNGSYEVSSAMAAKLEQVK